MCCAPPAKIHEAAAVANLQHPNIVSVHEVGVYDDSIYIVSDLVDGIYLLLRSELHDPVNLGNPEEWTVLQMAEAIRELSTPVMEVWDDVLALPIVGVVDTQRSMDIMTSLLESVAREHVSAMI